MPSTKCKTIVLSALLFGCSLPALAAIYNEQGGMVVVEAVHFDSRTAEVGGPHRYVIVPDENPGINVENGGVPFANSRTGHYVQNIPSGDQNRNSGGLAVINSPPYLDFRIRINTPGDYQLFIRAGSANGSSNSGYVQILELQKSVGGPGPDWFRFNAQPETAADFSRILLNADDANSGNIGWMGYAGLEVQNGGGGDVPAVWTISKAGNYTLRWSQREAGAALDAFILQLSNKPAPTSPGPPESATTTVDTTPPGLSQAFTHGNANAVAVVFSKAVSPSTATNKGNYAIDNGVVISSASMGVNDHTVILNLGAPLAMGKTYKVTVNNVQDTVTPPNTIVANSTASFKLSSLVQITIFDNTAGGTDTNSVISYANGRLSGGPTRSFWNSSFETPTWENGDNYLGQVQAYLVPDTTGDYTFAIATDDSSFLFLSTDDKPANKVPIAFVNGWTNQRQYTKYPDETSAPVHLIAGKKYYLQALWVEGGGGDGVAVTWNTTGAVADNDPAITGDNLLPFKTLGNVVITNQPQSLAVTEGQSATFTLGPDGVDGLPPYAFQWQRNGANIPYATDPTYNIPVAQTGDNNAKFACVVNNDFGSVTSSVATLTVTTDVTPPKALQAGKINLPNFTVSFSKPLDASTATNLANYVLKTVGGTATPISKATLSASGSEVTLTAAGVAVGTEYRLTLSNIKDRSAAGNLLATTTLGLFPQYVSGFGVMQVYDNAGFTSSQASLDSLVANNAKLTPTRIEIQTAAETPSWEDGDNYGRRFAGLLVAPETGDYLFHISSDDQSALYLSTDDTPAHLSSAPICNVTGWTNQRQWDKYPEQASSPVRLVKGQRYYFAAYQVEGGGGDGVSLGWELPSAAGTITVIPGSALSALVNSGASTVTLSQQPKAASTEENRVATFTVKATGSSELGNTVGYQWQKDGADIAGATSASYTTPKLALSDNGGKYRCVISVPGKSVTSDEVALVVIKDTTPPQVVLASNPAGSPYLTLVFDELLDSSTVSDPNSFKVTGGTVTNVILAPINNPDHNTVLAYVSGIASANATVTISGVKDLAGNALNNAAFPIKTPLYAVNFQSGPNPSSSNANAPTPAGYLPDIGLKYGDRGNGMTYGWDVDNQAPARWRQNSSSPDLRYDTLIHMGKPLPAGRIWQIAVPNGYYQVYLVGGEPSNSDEYLNIDVQGVLAMSSQAYQPDSARWLDGLVTVAVNNGKLSVSNDPVIPDPTVANNKIDFIEVFPAAAPPSANAPKLTVSRSGANVVISWPTADGAGFTLQQAGSLSAPTSWSPVTQTPATSGANSTVTLPITAGNQFFQLKK